MMMPTVSVIIPTRSRESAGGTVESLAAQTFQDFEIIIRVDQGRGQAWARNDAAEAARGEYLLFSDADILWRPTALRDHLKVFAHHPSPLLGYVYGAYELLGRQGQVIETLCDRAWNWEALKVTNFVSTMVLMRRELFLKYRFDETFRRLEDWELWLRMGLDGYVGAYIGDIAFATSFRNTGVTFSGEFPHETYERALRSKLGL